MKKTSLLLTAIAALSFATAASASTTGTAAPDYTGQMTIASVPATTAAPNELGTAWGKGLLPPISREAKVDKNAVKYREMANRWTGFQGRIRVGNNGTS